MGKVITTHLVDGDPRGIRNVFISNKICNMYVIPRQHMTDAIANEDIQLEQPAFYILLGGEDDFSALPQAYIGQTENFKDRVKSHENKKVFWNTTLVFIAKDNSLTKADVQFIEAKAIKKAKKVKAYSLSENKNQPTPPNLPPHLRDAVSEFIEDIELLTAFIGCGIFTSATPKRLKAEADTYHFKSRGGDAKAIYHDGIMTVLEGSIIAPTNSPSFKSKSKRNEMLANLTKQVNGQYILKINKDFTSPSTAATFVCGNNTNGWIAWKNNKNEALDLIRNKD